MIIIDRDLRPTAKHDQAIAYWWHRKLDSYDIARKLGIQEAVVYSRLTHVRMTYRGERQDLVGQVSGDPPAGRSALDQKRREGGV